jgi:hypothetical protein
MSTKNLARTIIEGGRARYNRFERGQSHREERALTRDALARAAQHEDGFDALAIGKRQKVYKRFDDKLAAPERWLRNQVGRPWHAVRAEMFARFDPRTLPGRHIIYCHMLRGVHMYWDPELTRPWLYRRDHLFVDRRGILRFHPREARAREPGVQYRATYLASIMNERRVGGSGDALYWFVIARRCVTTDLMLRCAKLGNTAFMPHVHYRQDRRLTPDELAFWNGMCRKQQDEYSHPTGNDPS